MLIMDIFNNTSNDGVYFVTGTVTGNRVRANDSRFKSMISVFFLYFKYSNSMISNYLYFKKIHS